jgi:hypothetical protein
MSKQQDRACELLTKAEVVRQYRYPRALLDDDIRKRRINCFFTEYSRYYIPRHEIERRINELMTRRVNVDHELRRPE